MSIRNTATGESRWIAVGDDDPWRIVDADAEEGTATLIAGGLRLRLLLADESGGGEEAPPTATSPRTGAFLLHARLEDDDRRNRENAFASLRAEHPEYFLSPNAMSDEQRRVAANAIEAVNRRLSEARAGETRPEEASVVPEGLH